MKQIVSKVEMIPKHHYALKGAFIFFTMGLLVRFKYFQFLNPDLEYLDHWLKTNMTGFTYNLLGFVTSNFAIYLGTGSFFHWHYYKNRRELSEEWKCQPLKWIPPHLELHELLLGSFNILWGSTLGATIATYILNGGSATCVYFQHDAYGYVWLIFQVPIIFVFLDYVFYLHHRVYHLPWFYKRFHKLHHMYKQPTSFSVVAFHPFEELTEHLLMFSPMFFIPVYWVNMLVIYLYMYIHGILAHSGIKFTNYWWQPFQADAQFHDIHHEFTHYNFAFNIVYWDKLHGTVWKKGNQTS